MLLDTGHTMQEDRGGTGRLAGAPVEGAEEPGAAGLEGHAIHTRRKARHAAAPPLALRSATDQRPISDRSPSGLDPTAVRTGPTPPPPAALRCPTPST